MITKNDIIKEIPRMKNIMNKLNINDDLNQFKKYIKNMPSNEFNYITNIISKNYISKKRKRPRYRYNNLRRLSNRGGSSSSSESAQTWVDPDWTLERDENWSEDEASPGEIRSLLFMTCLTLYIYYIHGFGWPLSITGMATLATPRFVRDINQRIREHPFHRRPYFNDDY